MSETAELFISIFCRFLHDFRSMSSSRIPHAGRANGCQVCKSADFSGVSISVQGD